MRVFLIGKFVPPATGVMERFLGGLLATAWEVSHNSACLIS